jgi:hypothetical protein
MCFSMGNTLIAVLQLEFERAGCQQRAGHFFNDKKGS